MNNRWSGLAENRDQRFWRDIGVVHLPSLRNYSANLIKAFWFFIARFEPEPGSSRALVKSSPGAEKPPVGI
jgi:hypothetical protein